MSHNIVKRNVIYITKKRNLIIYNVHIEKNIT